MLCDFCSLPAPAWRYPATSFHDMFGGRSVADWLACEDCHALIEAGNLAGLVRRALHENADGRIRAMADQQWAIDYTRDLYRGFWRARRGTAHQLSA